MSMRETVKIEGLDALLADFKKAGGNAKPLVNAALVNSTNHMTSEARHRAAHAFGTLQRSIMPEVHYPVGEVAVNESYGIDVEEGTGPHMPPPRAIQRWAKKKGIPDSAVWPIVNSIKKKGTRAQPFFKPAWEASQMYINAQFEQVTDRLLAALAGRGR